MSFSDNQPITQDIVNFSHISALYETAEKTRYPQQDRSIKQQQKRRHKTLCKLTKTKSYLNSSCRKEPLTLFLTTHRPHRTTHGLPYKWTTHGLPYKWTTHGLPYKWTTHGLPYKWTTHGLPYKSSRLLTSRRSVTLASTGHRHGQRDHAASTSGTDVTTSTQHTEGRPAAGRQAPAGMTPATRHRSDGAGPSAAARDGTRQGQVSAVSSAAGRELEPTPRSPQARMVVWRRQQREFAELGRV